MKLLQIASPAALVVAAALLPLQVAGEEGSGRKAANQGDGEDGTAMFSKIPVVEAATLHTQTLEEAPASVTVITAGDIRKYGYRTLGEALSGVRGFYFSNDRMYDYSGVRGLAIPGDYNSRFLVMLNSHPLTENIYNSNNFFGQDFGLDMDMVERIEVIRGPSSALFGSNGMLAAINVITKSPVDHPLARASIEVGSFGERKAMMSASFDLGRGANLLLSGSIFNNTGRSLFYPDFAAPETNGGVAENVDSQKGYHTLANLTWGRWNFTGYFNNRDILVPAGGGNTIFNSQGQHVRDSRNYVGVSYTRDAGDGAQVRWQLGYDQYRYGDRWDYPLEDGGVSDNRTYNWGDWVSSQVIYSRPIPKLGTLTAGIQGTVEFRTLQINRDVSPEPIEYLNIDTPDRIGSIYAQQEWVVGPKVKAYLGARFDASKYYGNYVSPRLALVYQPDGKTSYKAVYGRPFRNPSAFERFYDDQGLSYAANPTLRRETAQAFELSAERKLGQGMTGLVNAYHYDLNNVIQGIYDEFEVMTYYNTGGRRSTGVELELRGRLKDRVDLMGSYVVQKASDRENGRHLPNSPGQIGKVRAGIAMARNKVQLSGGMQYLSERTTTSGRLIRPMALADITLSTVRLFRGYDLMCGVRNALNWQYDHPVDLSVERVRANGRTFFVKLIWQFNE